MSEQDRIMERINVRVDARLKEQLEAEARAQGVSPSDVVREAIEKHLRQQKPRETCLDIARRIGILGIYKDAPHDLSTNPKHMEGFGRD
jgi:metal-responsive CopG/Arc/MetJ family transcriptional regulator